MADTTGAKEYLKVKMLLISFQKEILEELNKNTDKQISQQDPNELDKIRMLDDIDIWQYDLSAIAKSLEELKKDMELVKAKLGVKNG